MSIWSDHVIPHKPFEKIGPSLWSVTGYKSKGGLPRNMVIYRLSDNSILIHSAVALDDEGMKVIESLGDPSILVVPNRFHRMDAGVYKERYPDIKVVCPEAARTHVEKVVSVDDTCENVLPSHGIICHPPAGIKPGELCYEIDSGNGKALIMTDLMFNLQHGEGLSGFIFKHLGSTGFFGLTKIGKFLMLSNKSAFQTWIREMSELEGLRFICMAHGENIIENAPEHMIEAANALGN